jgi:hypothetical protein
MTKLPIRPTPPPSSGSRLEIILMFASKKSAWVTIGVLLLAGLALYANHEQFERQSIPLAHHLHRAGGRLDALTDKHQSCLNWTEGLGLCPSKSCLLPMQFIGQPTWRLAELKPWPKFEGDAVKGLSGNATCKTTLDMPAQLPRMELLPSGLSGPVRLLPAQEFALTATRNSNGLPASESP